MQAMKPFCDIGCLHCWCKPGQKPPPTMAASATSRALHEALRLLWVCRIILWFAGWSHAWKKYFSSMVTKASDFSSSVYILLYWAGHNSPGSSLTSSELAHPWFVVSRSCIMMLVWQQTIRIASLHKYLVREVRCLYQWTNIYSLLSSSWAFSL